MSPKPLQRRYVTYYRVSTERQGRSGLGLEAQKAAVADFLRTTEGTVHTEFVEVQSGKDNDRPKLAEALKVCKLSRSTLLIAKLDRLSRNAAFLLTLQNAGVRFVACDMPDMNETVVGIMVGTRWYSSARRNFSSQLFIIVPLSSIGDVHFTLPTFRVTNDRTRA